MRNVYCCFLVILLLVHPSLHYWGKNYRRSPAPYNIYQPVQLSQTPLEIMVDVTNDLGTAILQEYAHTRGNFAFSPYGVVSVLVVLYEGAIGDTGRQIHSALGLPWNRDVTRIGLRDIHRQLVSYFTHEGYLSGLTLSKNHTALKKGYKEILRFYGYDIDLMKNPELATTTASLTTDATTIYPSTTDETTFPELPTTILSAVTEDVMKKSSTPTESTTISSSSTGANSSPPMIVFPTSPDPDESTEMTEEATTDPPTSSQVTTLSDETDDEPSYEGEEIASSTTEDFEELPTTIAGIPQTFEDDNENSSTFTDITVDDTQRASNRKASEEPAVNQSITEVPATEEYDESTNASSSATESLGILTLRLSTVKPPAIVTELSAVDKSKKVSQSVSTTKKGTPVMVSSTPPGKTETDSKVVAEQTVATGKNNTGTTADTDQDIAARIHVEGKTNKLIPETSSTEEKGELLKLRRKRWIRRGDVYPNMALELENSMYNGRVDHSRESHSSVSKFTFLVDGVKPETVPVMSYTTILPFAYVPQLDAKAVEFPLEDPRYRLLLVLPRQARGLPRLMRELQLFSLRSLYESLRPTRVHAIIPSFMADGFVILTPALQQLGIWDMFDPRRCDLRGMSDDPDLYVRNVEQSITVVIRNYMEVLDIQTRTMAARQVTEKLLVTNPFLYFILDTETQITLMAGKINDPLNSRIY